MFKVYFLEFIFMTGMISCQNMKKETIDVSQATIKIDSCGLSYKGKKLELGVPISEWEKILGKPDREFIVYLEKDKGIYVWDDLGIAVDNFQNGDGKVAWFYIFFLNLDSPDANKQMLNHARDWISYSKEQIEKRKKETESFLKSPVYADELSQRTIKEELERMYKESYIYPFKVYQGVVNLHGFPVQADMKIKDINAYRKNLSFSGEFGYVDQDIDGRNDSGETSRTYGGDYRASGRECKDGRLQYYEVTYTATGNLEYLKVGYESKNEQEDRKEREATWEERRK